MLGLFSIRWTKTIYGQVKMKPIVLALTLLWPSVGWAEQVAGYDVDRLADAIYRAEGGAKTAHPYGILAKYKTTTPRQACINTIRSKHREWVALGSKGDYLTHLAGRYAPIGSDTDIGTNKYWLNNVKQIYTSLIGRSLRS